MKVHDDKKIKNNLEKLTNLKELSDPIFSLYLGHQGKQSPYFKLLLSEFHSISEKKLTKKEKRFLKKDLERIESYLQESYDKRGRRTIVFFTNGKNLWEVFEFEFYIPTSFTIDQQPNLKPILDAIENHDKYLVILADRKKAKLFTVHLGEIEESINIIDNSVPQRVRANEEHFYGRSDKIFRHIEDHLNRHFKLIADKVSRFAKGKNINFIIIGGHEEMFKKMKNHLPKDLKDKVRGTFVTELNIPINKIFLESKKIAERINSQNINLNIH